MKKQNLGQQLGVALRALTWATGDDTGLSSMAICRHMMDLPGGRCSYPRDPSDMGRCLRLLELIPEWELRIAEMAKYGPGWEGLCAQWDYIKWVIENECGIDGKKSDKAPHSYRAIKLAIANGYRNSTEYECTFNPDGSLSTYCKIEPQTLTPVKHAGGALVCAGLKEDGDAEPT